MTAPHVCLILDKEWSCKGTYANWQRAHESRSQLPLHWAISNNTLLISVIGHKSGCEYTLAEYFDVRLDVNGKPDEQDISRVAAIL
jgi:hypothetical protein